MPNLQLVAYHPLSMNADDQGNPKNKAQHFHGGRRSHDSGTNYYSSEIEHYPIKEAPLNSSKPTQFSNHTKSAKQITLLLSP
jgi:hypothetical protein